MNAIVLCDDRHCIESGSTKRVHFQKHLENLNELIHGKIVVYDEFILNEDLDKTPIKGCSNIIISDDLSNSDFIDNCDINVNVMTIEDIIKLPMITNTNNIFIIGGEKVFNTLLPYINKIYMTYIDEDMGLIAKEAINKDTSDFRHIIFCNCAKFLSKAYFSDIDFDTTETERIDYCPEIDREVKTKYMIKRRK